MKPSLFARPASLMVVLAIMSSGWAAEQSAEWLTAESGLWSDAALWSSDPLAPNNGNGGFDFDVVIDASGNPYVVTVNEATTLNSFVLDAADVTLWINAAFRASSIINQGTVHLGDGTITNSSLINHGLIVVDQQHLKLNFPWANTGVIRLTNGGSLSLGGGGDFTNPGLIERIDGSVSWFGGIENTGKMINLDAFGGDVYLGATGASQVTINGGQIRSDSGYKLLSDPSLGRVNITLRNLDLGVDARFDRFATVTVEGNLTLSGGSRLSVSRYAAAAIDFRTSSLLANVLQGDGELVFDSQPGWDHLTHVETQRGLIIGEGITVRTGNGGGLFTGGLNDANVVTNHGKILATTAPIVFEHKLINHGLVHASGEGYIDINHYDYEASSGQLRASNGGTIDFGGPQAGAFAVDGGHVVLHATTILEGNHFNTGSSLRLRSTWTNEAALTFKNAVLEIDRAGVNNGAIELIDSTLRFRTWASGTAFGDITLTRSDLILSHPLPADSIDPPAPPIASDAVAGITFLESRILVPELMKVDNSNSTIETSAAGAQWVLRGGEIQGGHIVSPDGTALFVQAGQNTISAHVAADVEVKEGASLNLVGATIDGAVIRLEEATPLRIFDTTLIHATVLGDIDASFAFSNSVVDRLTLEGEMHLGRTASFGHLIVIGETSALAGSGVISGHGESGLSANGTLRIDEEFTLRTGEGNLLIGVVDALHNYGVLSAETSGMRISVSAHDGVINYGHMRAINNATLQVLSDWANLGVVLVDGGTFIAPTLDLTTGTFNFVSGTLAVGNITGDLVNQGGVLAPGSSPGITAIDGDYTQGAGGALAIELAGLTAGDAFDQVLVSGTAMLDGLLNVSLLDDFMPDASDTFIILEAAAIQGHFANAWGQVLFDGGVFDVTYTDTQVILSNYAIPEPSTLALLVVSSVLLARRSRRQA